MLLVKMLSVLLQACGPLWSYECGSSYYSTGICSRVNASFKFSRTIAPAFQSKTHCSCFANLCTSVRCIRFHNVVSSSNVFQDVKPIWT